MFQRKNFCTWRLVIKYNIKKFDHNGYSFNHFLLETELKSQGGIQVKETYNRHLINITIHSKLYT